MKITLTMLMLPLAILSANALSHEDSDPLLTQVMLNEVEMRGEDNAALKAQAWIGKDVNKLWLKADAERRGGSTESAEIQALYSRGLSAFWDLQIGARHDIKPTPSGDWGVLGIQGLTPFFFDMDAALFVGESGHTAARFAANYELLFTQRLILTPSLEVNFYGQNDVETGTGSGLSDAEAGLRLRYEIHREFAPYIGVNWEKKFGNTANIARKNKDTISNTEFVVGLHAWF